jgi:hypothetical protein
VHSSVEISVRGIHETRGCGTGLVAAEKQRDGHVRTEVTGSGNKATRCECQNVLGMVEIGRELVKKSSNDESMESDHVITRNHNDALCAKQRVSLI